MKKLPIWTAHYTSLESRHSEVTTNPYYILLPEECQRTVEAHRLLNSLIIFFDSITIVEYESFKIKAV